MNIYLLELEFNKYYIGKATTKIPNIKIKQHFQNNGSAWIKKYKPIRVINVISNGDILDVDKWTIKYMIEKGIDNVRGGSFCQINLSIENKITIKQIISHIKHFVMFDTKFKVNICVFELDHNKYYIGKMTITPNIRINNDCAWTKKYNPFRVINVISNSDILDIDKWTIKYMMEKGIDNVRGGSFCQINLSLENKITIKQIIRHANNQCMKCNKNNKIFQYYSFIDKKEDSLCYERKNNISCRDCVVL